MPARSARWSYSPRITPDTIARCRAEARQLRIEPGILRYIANIAAASRQMPELILGGSPRASVNLLLAAKTWAAMQGHTFVLPDDVKFLVKPVYRHRIILRPEAEIEGLSADGAIDRILARVEVPR